MRRLTAFFAPFVVALAMASGAYATVTHASGSVQVLHGTTVVATYTGARAPCASPTACTTTVPMAARDLGRVVKFCQASGFQILVQSFSSRTIGCDGKPDWTILITATRWDCTAGPTNCVETSENPGTWVTVNVVSAKDF
jgi:hypothetical protein